MGNFIWEEIMKNIKFVAVFAACGFVLSLLFGLFSHAGILSILLKALIFGIVFGILGFGISFLFNKFLLGDEAGDGDVDISTPTPKMSFSGNDDTKGQIVDITIKDEDLPESSSDNHFVVGDNHQLLNETDYGKSHVQAAPVAETAPDPNVSFMPVRNLETITNVSSKESIKPDATPVPEPAAASAPAPAAPSFVPENKGSSDNEIDTLPDISGFAIDNAPQTDASTIVEDVDSESGNEFVTTATRSMSSDAEVPEIKDASLYAKAISSVLSAEDT